jgi:4-amino-4-deoxy-L-arabinose transferase-like glycosyltransferase
MNSLYQKHPSGAGTDSTPAYIPSSGFFESRTGWGVVLFFVVLNAALLIVTKEGGQLLNAADGGSWYNPARALLKYGAFVKLDDPTIPMTYRQPLYPLFEATMLWLGGGTSLVPLVIGQILVLWITGLFARAMVEVWLPGYGLAALALVVFNPNAVATAHLVQSDTLYALFITACLWAVLRYARKPSLRPALLAGFFLGLSCLVRPTAQYLVFLLPLLLPFVAFAGGSDRHLTGRIGQGVAAAAVAGMLALPWMIHNQQAGQGFALSTPAVQLVYLRDNVAYLEKYAAGSSLAEADRKIYGWRDGYAAAYGAEWEAMSEHVQEKALIGDYARALFSYDLSVIAKGYAYGWGQFFGAPGAANFHNLLDLEASSAFTAMREKNFESHFGSVIYALKSSSLGAVTISVTAFIFVVFLRMIGLVGIVWMFMRRHYAVLLSCAGLIIYFAIIHLFTGNSRYRLPVEPALILLALYGIDGLRVRLRRER